MTAPTCQWCYATTATPTRHDHDDVCADCAARAAAGGTCDWCDVPTDRYQIVSTAGARCYACQDRALCGWCGEGPGDDCPDDLRCVDCCAEQHPDHDAA